MFGLLTSFLGLARAWCCATATTLRFISRQLARAAAGTRTLFFFRVVRLSPHTRWVCWLGEIEAAEGQHVRVIQHAFHR